MYESSMSTAQNTLGCTVVLPGGTGFGIALSKQIRKTSVRIRGAGGNVPALLRSPSVDYE